MLKSRQRNHSFNSDYDLQSDIDKIKAALADAAQDVKGRAGEMLQQSIEDVKERSTILGEDIGDYVAEKPLQSLGIAVLAGAVLGFLIRR
jgi:ElaB/YqjD/DUF883 family membrane-anchored ribosome-binding protein